MVKQLRGFVKPRYRGLAKNLARARAMFALANLCRARRQLPPGAVRRASSANSGQPPAAAAASTDPSAT